MGVCFAGFGVLIIVAALLARADSRGQRRSFFRAVAAARWRRAAGVQGRAHWASVSLTIARCNRAYKIGGCSHSAKMVRGNAKRIFQAFRGYATQVSDTQSYILCMSEARRTDLVAGPPPVILPRQLPRVVM